MSEFISTTTIEVTIDEGLSRGMELPNGTYVIKVSNNGCEIKKKKWWEFWR